MPSSAPESLAAELARLVRKAQSEDRLPSLSAAVFRAGETIWSDAVGTAGAAGERASPETQYRVGSITKTFTAAAVLALRDEGKLALDDPVGKHLPEVAHPEPTLRRLLAHSSGLQREFPDEMWETFVDPPREELLDAVAGAEQVLDPGAHWHYSNLAYALLGEVVARVSGAACERVIDERFLRPLGMARTTWLPQAPAAKGYFVEPYRDGLRVEADIVLRRSAAIGQLWSTAGDLARWGSFLCEPSEEGILAEAAVEQMHAVQVMAETERWTRAWGLGLELARRGDRIFGGHGGAMPGFLAYLVYSREAKTGAAVLANTSAWAGVAELPFQLAEKAIELLPPEIEEWRPTDPPPAEVEAILGRWWTEGNEVVLSYRAGRLEARLEGAPRELPPAVLEGEGEDRYRVVSGRERGELLRVVRDEAGVPVKLYWATYPCTRAPEVFGPAPGP